MNSKKEQGKNLHLAPINLQKYKKLLLFVDTETIGDLSKGEKAYPYDISYLVFDLDKARKKAKETDDINEIIEAGTVEKLSMINKDIFDNEYLMNSAFYRNKIPFYKWHLSNDKENYQKMELYEILERLNSIKKKYRLSTMVAYNSSFDYNSVNNLYEINTQIKKNEYKKLYQIDLWNITLQMFKNSKSYKEFCKQNNLITESGKNYLTNAETFYKYMSKKLKFVEHHTGLKDIMIELEMFVMLCPYIKGYKLDSQIDKKIFWKGGAYNIECSGTC